MSLTEIKRPRLEPRDIILPVALHYRSKPLPLNSVIHAGLMRQLVCVVLAAVCLSILIPLRSMG